MIIIINHQKESTTGNQTEVWTQEVSVDNLDEFLMKYITRAAGTDNRIIFNKYYPSSFVDIYYRKRFTFILREDKYVWDVPIEDVTVREFIKTHNIGKNENIILTESLVIGGNSIYSYVNDIVTWIPIFMLVGIDIAGRLFTIEEIMKRGRVIYRKLIVKSNKVASVNNVEEMITTNNKWTLQELENRTDVDSTLLEKLLQQLRYTQEGMYYCAPVNMKHREYYETTNKEAKEISELIWGEKELKYNDDYNIKRAVYELNYGITSLLFQSDYYGTDNFERMITILDCITADCNEIIHRGEGLRFVELTEGYEKASYRQIIVVENLINALGDYVSIICKIIDNNF